MSNIVRTIRSWNKLKKMGAMNKTKGRKEDNQYRLRSPMAEGREH